MRRRAEWAACLALGLLPGAVTAQAPAAGVYRVYQGEVELSRETFRRQGDTLEQESLVPPVNLRATSQTVFGRDGAVASFRLSVWNAAGDSSRGSYTVTVQGDSVRIASDFAGRHREATRSGRPFLVLPPQSTFTFVELAHRAGGRDTTVSLLVAGADTLLPAQVRFLGDSAEVAFAGLRVLGRQRAAGIPELAIPIQRVRAVLAGPYDTLPPLPGLRRAAPDYAAPPGAAWAAEEVRVPVGAAPDSFSLGCTLTRPAAGRPPFPAAITITGSGYQTRDEELWPLVRGYRLFGEVAERLSAAGIAVLRCDDRSVGASTGRVDSATTADLAEDTRAQLRWLWSRPEIDRRRIALIGHSEGGIIGPLLAAQEPSVAALVLLAAPAKSGTEILVDQVRWPILVAPGLTEEERALQLREAEAAMRADSFPVAPWLRWFRHYDPLKAARLVKQPVLVLQGALDRQVSAGQADTLAAAIRSNGNRGVAVEVFPGLNHLFVRSATDGSPAEYPALRDPHPPAEVLDRLTGWLAGVLRARPARE